MKRAFHAMSWVLALSPLAALADCPVTLPSSSPVDVPGMRSGGTYAWYGSEALAVLLPAHGRWKGMGPARNFRDKFWIWRRGYEATGEERPALTITGVKLHDGEETERLRIDRATNAFGKGWASMLVGMEYPSAGCWRVTVTYVYVGITHELEFVVDVVAD
jgi:hypothetical protein